MHAVVGLGSNLGSREECLRAALDLLEATEGVRLVACSRLYCTEPVGPPQPCFLNAAVRLETRFGPRPLLARLLAVEAELGRVRDVRWGPRVLDLDVLWSDQPVEAPDLHVPHPRLEQRPFALAPLLDVAPELEPAYGPALARAGGSPPDVAELPRDAAVAETADEGRRVVTRHARDAADAVAAAVAAWLRAGGRPGASRPEVRPFEVASSAGDVTLGIARAVREETRRGLRAGRVTLSELRPERARGRIVGLRAEVPAVPDVERVEVDATAGQVRARVVGTHSGPTPRRL